MTISGLVLAAVLSTGVEIPDEGDIRRIETVGE